MSHSSPRMSRPDTLVRPMDLDAFTGVERDVAGDLLRRRLGLRLLDAAPSLRSPSSRR